MRRDWLKQLPKTELHCHLDGSLSLSVIRQLAKMADVSIPDSDDALRVLVTAAPDVVSLNDYLETFDFIRPLLQTKEALTLAAYDVARQAAEENVLYTEIRFAPELSTDKGLTVAEVVEAVCLGLRQAEEEFGIVAKALICGLRQTPMEETKTIFKEVKKANHSRVVGMDFAGNEVDFPTETVADGIAYGQSLGYPMTFHAGECGCVANIAQAIALGVKRTGHTTAITNHPEVIQNFIEANMTAELCLVSNFHTKAIKTIADFPYLQLKAAGANISINTDNRTVSDTNLTREYGLFVDYFETSVVDFLQHNQEAIRGSFATEEEKAKLLSKLTEAYKPFLENKR